MKLGKAGAVNPGKIYWLALAGICMTSYANATVLWMGGEDIDFPNGSGTCVPVMGSQIRTGYARVSLRSCLSGSGGIAVSTPFSGGAITSGWISVRAYNDGNNSSRFAGFVKSGTSNSLIMGTSASGNTKVALWKYDGTTWTELAASAAGAITGSALHKMDMQLINYGASATVNIYVDALATPALTYTGDVTAGGSVNVDSVAISGNPNSTWYASISEAIVADSDTRQLSLVSLAPNAAGDLNQWTGSYTNVNPTWINDTSYVTDNTSGNLFESNLINLPTGIGAVAVQGVKVAARAAKYGSGMGSLSLGVKTNATVSAPAAVAQGVGWATTETYYLTNPVTSSTWTSSEIDALQLLLKSAP